MSVAAACPDGEHVWRQPDGLQCIRCGIAPSYFRLDDLAAAQMRINELETDVARLRATLRESDRLDELDIAERQEERNAAQKRIATLEAALSKINAIRNSIVGRQTISWSAHIYPLVAALDEAGCVSEGYKVARAKAEDEQKALDAALAQARAEGLEKGIAWCRNIVSLTESDRQAAVVSLGRAATSSLPTAAPIKDDSGFLKVLEARDKQARAEGAQAKRSRLTRAIDNATDDGVRSFSLVGDVDSATQAFLRGNIDARKWAKVVGNAVAQARAEGFREGVEKAAKACKSVRDIPHGTSDVDVAGAWGHASGCDAAEDAIRALLPSADGGPVGSAVDRHYISPDPEAPSVPCPQCGDRARPMLDASTMRFCGAAECENGCGIVKAGPKGNDDAE